MTDFIHHPKNPPPKRALDATLRRFARLSYHGFIVGCFVIGVVAAEQDGPESTWSEGPPTTRVDRGVHP